MKPTSIASLLASAKGEDGWAALWWAPIEMEASPTWVMIFDDALNERTTFDAGDTWWVSWSLDVLGDDDGQAPPPDTTTTPAPTPPPTTAPATTAPPPPTDPPPSCGVDPQAPEITDNIGQVPPPFPDASWNYGGESNYDPCAALSYARLDTAGGTGSSPVHLMLFHDGEYIGTATECDFGFTSVDGTTADSITVTYRWPREGDANASPSGTTTVTFQWTGESVTMQGTLPQDLQEANACT